MKQRLAAMPKRRLLAFRRQYDRASGQVKLTYWAAPRATLTENRSDDHGDDFAAWVVSGGRGFWQEVRRHPESVQSYLNEFDPLERTFVRPDFLASAVYHERFGEEMLLVLYHPEMVEKHRTVPKQKDDLAEPGVARDRGGIKVSGGSTSHRRPVQVSRDQ
jgi:hypothetical protein